MLLFFLSKTLCNNYLGATVFEDSTISRKDRPRKRPLRDLHNNIACHVERVQVFRRKRQRPLLLTKITFSSLPFCSEDFFFFIFSPRQQLLGTPHVRICFKLRNAACDDVRLVFYFFSFPPFFRRKNY